MKIIFLDVDGVLNNQTNEGRIKTSSGYLNQPCVDNFNKLVADTGAKVVLSSTWRMDKDDATVSLLGGGVQCEFVGKTPILRDRWALRGNEIHAWIVENQHIFGKDYHEYHSFVILDDDSDMLLWHQDNYFRTDPWIGLTPSVAYRAARYLNRY